MLSITRMWNYVPPFAHTGHFMMGPNKSQKRDFGFHIPSTLHIAPGKSFSNPNFVNKQYPNVHNHHYVHHMTQKSQTDKVDKNTTSVNSLAVDSNSMLIDKSADIVDHTEYHETKQDMYKRSKRSRRNRKRKATQKRTDRKRPDMEINLNSTLETYMEVDNSMESSDSFKPDTNSDNISDLQNDGSSFKEVPSDTMVTTLPFIPSMRERQISVADSEDSFIVFQSGTDEELVFSESDDDSIYQFKENESTVEEDLNSSSDIPCKKVRFAGDSDLCEVHRMVQWSYAYQQARKGPWEEYARDRDRFSKRIKDLEIVLSPVFDSKHRESVYNERFKDKIVC